MGLEEGRQRLLAQIREEIGAERIARAIAEVPREAFVPAEARHLAYEDAPLGIGYGQTISQPFIVALMTWALDPGPEDWVLEVGTGSGYQTAVLSRLARHVVTVDRIPELLDSARARLHVLGYDNVEVRLAGDTLGCPERGPYDRIMVTAGAPRLPMELLDQLVIGGWLVIPVGSRKQQDLLRVARTPEGHHVESLGPCHFVPLVGPQAWVQE